MVVLIFAPAATDAGRFEDYARKMYPQYSRLNVPTWIIGPALGAGPLMERPADALKVWPAREPIERLRPAQLNARLDELATGHCGLQTGVKPGRHGQRQGFWNSTLPNFYIGHPPADVPRAKGLNTPFGERPWVGWTLAPSPQPYGPRPS